MSVERVIRIAIADDHQLVREGLVALIARHANMEVVGQAATGAGAVAIAVSLCPDVIILDVRMPGPPAAETVRRIRRLAPDVHVVVLTMHVNAI